MRIFQVLASTPAVSWDENYPFSTQGHNFVLVMYSPGAEWHQWASIGDESDYVVDFYSDRESYPEFQEEQNTLTWDKLELKHYAGSYRAQDLLDYKEDLLIEYAPFEWIVTKSMLEQIRPWILLHAPELVLKYAEEPSFGGPA